MQLGDVRVAAYQSQVGRPTFGPATSTANTPVAPVSPVQLTGRDGNTTALNTPMQAPPAPQFGPDSRGQLLDIYA